MQKPPKKKAERKSLGRSIVDALLPARYEAPRNRVRPPLVGWSGLPTDPHPVYNPYAWTQDPPQHF